MINSPRSQSLQKDSLQREKALSAMYEKIIHKFEKEAIKVKNTNSNQDFDDTIISSRRKILPSLEFQSPQKGKRKFYSKKLILNDTLYINERREKSIHQVMTDFKKLSIPSPFKNQGILSERNRRIKELYQRVERNLDSPDSKIKFTKQIEGLKKESQLDEPPQMSETVRRVGEKSSKIFLREAKERREKL